MKIEVIVAIIVAVIVSQIAGVAYRKWRDKHAKKVVPNAQTVASEKYQKKAGYMTKGFKLKRDVAERFAEACEKAGVSQAAQITAMMNAFIEEQNRK